MKLSLSLRIKTKLELFKIFFTHINNRWNITKDKIIYIVISLIVLFIVPFASNFLYAPESDAESAFIIGFCFVLELFIFLSMYCSFKKDEIKVLGKEVSYGTKTIQFILSSYDKIMDRCMLFIPKYKYFFQPVRKIEELDLIVANLILIKIYELYFKNVDKYGPSTVRYIPATVVSDLLNHKKFREFYSVLFFDPKLKGKKTHYDALVVNVLDAVVSELYTKDWFTDYYDPKKIDMIISNILEQWSYLAIQYNLNIEDYLIPQK